jgi:hypothetical protein
VNKKIPTIQVITKKINVKKFIEDEFYYDRKEKEIRREVKRNADIVIVNLKPDQKIKDLWVLEMLLHLQREFSDIVIIPDSDMPIEELEDWFGIFRPKEVLKAC